MELLVQLDVVATPDAEGRRGPFTDAIDRQNCRLLKGGREERAGSMRLVMLGVQNLAIVVEGTPNLAVLEQLFFHPRRPRESKLVESSRRDAKIGFQNPFELEQWLVVEADVGQVCSANPGRLEAIANSVRGERRVALLPSETLFLCGGDDVAIAQKARC